MQVTHNKKGSGPVFSGLNMLFTALAAIVIIIAVTFLIIANVLTQIATTEGINAACVTTRTIAYNATLELQAATATIPGWVPLIVITVIGGLILLLVRIFNK